MIKSTISNWYITSWMSLPFDGLFFSSFSSKIFQIICSIISSFIFKAILLHLWYPFCLIVHCKDYHLTRKAFSVYHLHSPAFSLSNYQHHHVFLWIPRSHSPGSLRAYLWWACYYLRSFYLFFCLYRERCRREQFPCPCSSPQALFCLLCLFSELGRQHCGLQESPLPRAGSREQDTALQRAWDRSWHRLREHYEAIPQRIPTPRLKGSPEIIKNGPNFLGPFVLSWETHYKNGKTIEKTIVSSPGRQDKKKKTETLLVHYLFLPKKSISSSISFRSPFFVQKKQITIIFAVNKRHVKRTKE